MKKNLQALFAVMTVVLMLFACTKEVAPVKPPVVDAGTNVSIKVSADSVLLTASIEADGEIAEYLWKKLSGEGTPDILTPNAKSTWVKNLTQGYYVFQLTVKDEKGNLGTDTVSVDVLPTDTLSVSVAPSNNVDEVHLFGNSSTIDQTDTIAPELLGGSGTYYGDPVNIRGLLKFDLSNIPENAAILSAKLTLYSNPTPLNGIDGNPNYGSNNALLIQRVTGTWMYNTVNWRNQPVATTDDQIEIPHTNEPLLDLVDIDVKTLIEAMRAEGNKGFLIKLKTEAVYNFRIFCSSKYSDAQKHPKLDIVYAY
jgi:hypothetical protein